MNREEILRLARQAGGMQFESDSMDFLIENVVKFADLVYERGFMAGMKNEEQITIEAVAAERQRCADIADAHASIEGIAQRIAAEIRGQQ